MLNTLLPPAQVLNDPILDEDGLPRLVTFLNESLGKSTTALYQEMLRQNLKKLLPAGFFEKGDIQAKLRKKLPLVVKNGSEGLPQNLSFTTLYHYRAYAFKFFFEMVSHWLIPGEKLDVIMVYAIDFNMPDVCQQVYTLCEIMIRVEDEAKLQLIEKAFSLLEFELLMGLESKHISTKILEVKGLANDEKAAFIQEMICRLVKKMPNLFDHDVVVEMQHFMLITKGEFKKKRSWRHLARVISVQYFFRKELLLHVAEMPKKRKVFIKIFRSYYNSRETLSIVVGMNFLTEKEVFEERQLIRAIHHPMPSVKVVSSSYVMNRRSGEPLAIAYIEVEKPDGSRFTNDEIVSLKTELPKDVKGHVEHLMHPVFQPRNEEEIMRNILALSLEIKYPRDIPQVFITFDQQTRANLFYTVLIVRVGQTDQASVQEVFKGHDSFLKYIHDRIKTVGIIRKKYPKQATVFRVKFRKEGFLRTDHSIDLSQARQALVNELTRLLGPFRDFNGGMISKQNELFLKVKETLLNEGIKFNSVMLENFFYSLAPVIMQTILEPEAFKTLFILLTEVLRRGLTPGVKFHHKIVLKGYFVYAILLTHDRSIADELDKSLVKFKSGSELASADISLSDMIATGYIFRGESESRKLMFTQILESAFQQLEQH